MTGPTFLSGACPVSLGAMNAVVVYESLTGNTRAAGDLIAAGLTAAGVNAAAYPIQAIDMQALQDADLVVVGSWTDGLIFVGQRPGGSGRLRKLPRIDGTKAAVYCTYAVDLGKTLEKLEAIVTDRGGDVVGGMAIHRGDLAGGATEFVQRLLGALDVTTA